MPDPDRKTISATESPALFHVSPYATAWMLYQRFARGMDIDNPENSRMDWGRRMQPLLLDQAGQDLRFEIHANDRDVYERRGQLGCTRDGVIFCPDRGPGTIECKVCFDYATWMRAWEGGAAPPKHVEIQTQHQMLVGDGNAPFRWGVIAVWIAGEMHYFERDPIPTLWERITTEASNFFNDVNAGNEPDPFGVPVELPWLRELFPTQKGTVLDLTGEADEDVREFSDIVLRYRDAREQESVGKATCEPLRAKILAVAKDANEIHLPSGLRVRITTSGPHKGKRITVFVPETAGNMRPGDVPVGEVLNAK